MEREKKKPPPPQKRGGGGFFEKKKKKKKKTVRSSAVISPPAPRSLGLAGWVCRVCLALGRPIPGSVGRGSVGRACARPGLAAPWPAGLFGFVGVCLRLLGLPFPPCFPS